MSDLEIDALAVAKEVEAVELAATLLYTAYRYHREYVEGMKLPPWPQLPKHKQERFRAMGRTARTFMRHDHE